VITVRITRLVRVPDLHTFRRALASLACAGSALDARDRFVIVPTRAAGSHLLRSIEDQQVGEASTSGALLLPDFITAAELVSRLAERAPHDAPLLTGAEREALLGVACRDAIAEGIEPPFRLRPGLVAEILRFYDTLHRNRKDIDTFERLALGMLEPGALDDRGAQRLVRQTRFLVSAFRHFDSRRQAAGAVDEHAVRRHLLDTPAARPWRHAIVAVGDRSLDPHGLFRADWDLLARVPGLERLDVVATDHTVAGAFHERIRDLLPGIDEVRVEDQPPARSPVLLVPPRSPAASPADRGGEAHCARDREEEVAGFARWARHAVRHGEVSALDRMALIVRQPLPYVYVARDILRSGGIPCQMFDALPLAAEPYAAALDLVVSCVSANFARGPAIAMLRSPHLRFDGLTARDISALDQALSSAGYLGDVEALERIDMPAAAALARVGGELLPLRELLPLARHLEVLTTFLSVHDQPLRPDDPLRERQLRARAAVLATLNGLREAYARFDATPMDFDAVAATVRRWIEGQTFAPRTGDSGVHLVDSESARFGDFEAVQLAGLVDGEWPDRPRRDIFYAGGILRELGWPAEADRVDGARAAFRDLLRLPASYLVASTFTLEDDALVAPSTFVDELERSGLEAIEQAAPTVRMFEYEADPVERRAHDEARYRGQTTGHRPPAYSLSALERYQDCPFKFFAADVLRLGEVPEDEPALSPRARGRFIHEVFQRFFEAWDAGGAGTITADRLDEARALFEAVARPLVARLPEADASLEWTRLFGSAISVGIVDVVLGLEASRPAAVRERWLEYRLEGDFSLGALDGRRVPLKGVADRIDLLEGNRLRVIDYKSGYPPNVKRALQVAVYALCAQERLGARGAGDWTIDQAAYVAFAGKRPLVPVVKAGGKDAAATLGAARDRLLGLVDDITSGAFPPRPHEPMMCTYCAYPSVCRKDYVGDQ
jgi:RecB family exonuclease